MSPSCGVVQFEAQPLEVTVNAAQHQDDLYEGQIVSVKPRTWAGINRPGGRGRVTVVHRDEAIGRVTKVDVRYILGGRDKCIDVCWVEPFIEDKDQPKNSGVARRHRTAAPAQNEEPNKTETNRRQVKLQLDHGGLRNKHVGSDPDKNNDENLHNAVPSAKLPKSRVADNGKSTKQLGNETNTAIENTTKPPVRRKIHEDIQTTSSKLVVVSTRDIPRAIVTKTTISSPSSLSAMDIPSPQGVLGNTPKQKLIQGGCVKSCATASPSPQKYDNRAALFPLLTQPFAVSSPQTPSSNRKSKERNFCDIHDARNNSDIATPLSQKKYKHVPDAAGSPRVTLQQHHHRIIQDASRFIEDVVVSHKSQECQQDNCVAPQKEASSAAIDPNLLATFSAALAKLWELSDYGGIVEQNLVEKINQCCDNGTCFPADHVEEILVHLSQVSKVMRSDGVIYLL